MAEEMSKSAKRRAAKKTRDAAGANEEIVAPVAPISQVPVPAAKASSKKAAKSNATAPPEAPARSVNSAPKTGKASASTPVLAAKTNKVPAPEPAKEAPPPKGKANAKAAAAEPPKAAAVQPPAAKAKGKAKAEAKGKQEPAPAKKEAEEIQEGFFLDDGNGGDWEEIPTVDKKAAKRKEKLEEKAKAEQERLRAEEEELAAKKAEKEAAIKAAIAAKRSEPQAVPHDKSAVISAVTDKTEPTHVKDDKAQEQQAEDEEDTEEVVATIELPDGSLGKVIGPRGAKIKMVSEKTGVTRIDTMGGLCTITGPPEAVEKAEVAVKELIAKGYCSLSYDDFQEIGVMVPCSSFPDIIGKQGSVIQALKESLNVEVSVPKVPNDPAPPPDKRFKVLVAGSGDSVEKAREVMESIVMYYHHEVTHPNQVHQELDVEAENYRFIIGRAGSEMRHIQNSYRVRVYIPRDHSVNKKVVVVGEEEDVKRASTYIEKVIGTGNASVKAAAERQDRQEPQQREQRDWDDEGPMDNWMKRYIKTR
eukprot:TRINITY_DN1014_c0_g1_i2.p1 TRINITY_DN1014_c0_g1~~TRINITY_DN1014_c0_g1_i2.p1  ORF type:complete len:532 (+),score=140.64 TRINITY_DN1014_c0_g1_i2:93-1688(+)